MKTFSLTAVTAVLLLAPTAATAQCTPTYGSAGGSCVARPHFAYPRYHSSTAAEGYLRGMAMQTLAQGYYNYMTAQAQVAAANARQLQIQNREQAASTHFSMREANREARANERRPRTTPEQAARLAAAGRPDSLSPSEFDPRTDHISWPAVLQSSEFDVHRTQVEEILACRASSGQLAADEAARVEEIAQLMLTTLRGQIRELPPSDYLSGRRFIERLAHSAQQPFGHSPVGLAGISY